MTSLLKSLANMASERKVRECGDHEDHEPMDFQEEELATSSSSIADTKFDITVGHIEDIIMDDDFQNMQQEFLEKYYLEFEDTEENKFVYTDIHNEYTKLVETFLEKELMNRMPGFAMEEFSKQLVSRKNDLDGEIFEMLLTFSDFMLFKEMFIDYRAAKEGKTVDFSDGITVTPISSNFSLEPSVSLSTSKSS